MEFFDSNWMDRVFGAMAIIIVVTWAVSTKERSTAALAGYTDQYYEFACHTFRLHSYF